MVGQYPTVVLSHRSCLMATGGQAHATSTWASKRAPKIVYSILLLRQNWASDVNSVPRSETDLAINIRKATSIGQLWHSGCLEVVLEVD